MEQQLYFVLGMLSVIFIGMIVGMFRINEQVSKNSEKLKSIEETIVDIYNVIGRNSELIDRRVDGEIDRTNHMVDEVYRSIDSRFDKFENKLKEKTLLKD
jgi:site-specific DNA-adenine methylase